MYDICFYHKDCYDGFTAAWIARRYMPGIELVPVGYGDNVEASSLEGKHVLITDFSFPSETLRDMIRWGAESVTVIDHHKSAATELVGFTLLDGTVALGPQEFLEHCTENKLTPIRALFDMERSGAQLTLDALMLQMSIPYGNAPSMHARLLIDYVADRDLWRFKLPHSKAINAWIMSHDFDLSEWDAMFGILLRPFVDDDHWVITAGYSLMRQRDLDVKRIIASGIRQRMTMRDYRFVVINCSYVFASDLGNELAKTDSQSQTRRLAGLSSGGIAATYVDGDDGRRFSLRSVGEIDVSLIAAHYGKLFGTTGGGHKNAAGFLAPHGWQGDE